MTIKRGDIWLANLDPIRGSEQAGTRPVLVFQNDVINAYTTTVVAIALTTNLRRAALPSCVKITRSEDGLTTDSVILGHQLRVLDHTRLHRKLGTITPQTMALVEQCVLFTMGIV